MRKNSKNEKVIRAIYFGEKIHAGSVAVFIRTYC